MTGANLNFLTGGGETGALIAAFDWSKTALGPIEGWPQSVRTAVSLMLRSSVPMVSLWHAPGVMIYNDAYAVFAGNRHPRLLGSNVREGWPEVADFNDNIMKVVHERGETRAYKAQQLFLDRRGALEPAWLDLDYSPILDEAGAPVAVIAIIIETTDKVLAERATREAEAQLRRAQEAGGIGVYSVDLGTDTVSGTPEFCRIFGLDDCDGIPSTEIEALVVPEDLDLASSSTQRRDATAALEAEYRVRRAGDGALRHIARKGDFEFDADGRAIRMVGVVQDVTEQHRVRSELEASEARFRGLAQAIPNQVWTAQPDGSLDWFNEQIYSYGGAPPGSLDGSRWTSMVHPDDIPAAATRWAEALATGNTYQTEFRLRDASGSYRWHLARAVPLRDAEGAITRWVGTNTDIEEQRAVGDALRGLNATLEAEVEARTRERDRAWKHSRDLQLVLDGEGVIRAANDAWQAILGYSAADIVGRDYADFVVPDDVTASDGALQVALAEPLLAFENRYYHKDGGIRWISWVAAPQDGVVYASGRHVTAEKEAAEKLEAAQDALRQSQKMEAVGQLTGGIAHDFNNLLQGITGSLDLVQKRISQGRLGELDRFITGAMSAANRAAALTHRLLAFSRRQPLDPRAVRANPLIASMEDLLRRTLGEHIELELVLAGGLWLTLCDPNQLENAVLNLAINARDAMPEGGKLIIETCNTHLDSAYAASQRDVRPGQYVCICVTDTGVGMAPETVAKAFDPFFTTKPIGQGTGLGLSMIYGFARQSEGYAKLYSEPAKGTTFKLYLPRHLGESEEEQALPELTDAHATDAGETVLVVEDEPVVRGLIVEVLSDLGYRAIEASDGPSGLEILRSSRRIDLLVTDIGLPGLNGRQMADAGRALRPELKILFMTGYAENAALASGFLEPGMTMVTKPFSMEALATRIREIIGP